MAIWDNSKTDQWMITSEERAKHDNLFKQQNPIGGFLSAEQAKRFFLQSGLNTQKLGQIWALADVNADGRMDNKEFSIAMHLIRHSLHGGDLPSSLPHSLRLDPPPIFLSSPHMALLPSFTFGGVTSVAGTQMPTLLSQPPAGLMLGMSSSMNYSTSMSNTMPPAMLTSTGGGSDWAIPMTQRLKYGQMFTSSDKSRKEFLTGPEAKALLSQSNLQQSTLAQIWTLSDIDGNGNLSLDEFCVAMYLVDMAKSGQSLPSILPLNLMPPSYRGKTLRSVTNAASPVFSKNMTLSSTLTSPIGNDVFSDLSNFNHRGSPIDTNEKSSTVCDSPKFVVTFEDKRRENFEKGQAELERRRAMLEEQKKREAEERAAFERREEEKREQARLEQERRKQIELEKHLAKQRKLEQEREEQRVRELKHKEAVRRDLERQRQLEREKLRREQLMSEKQREQTSVDKLRMEVGNLRQELTLLGTKRSELSEKIEQAHKNIISYSSVIEGMKTKRDNTLSDIDRFQLGIDEWSRKLNLAEQERIALDKQTRAAVSSYDDSIKSLASGCTSKRSAVRQLKADISQFEQRSLFTEQQIEQYSKQLNVLKSGVTQLQSDIQRLEKQKNSRKAEREDSHGKTNGKSNPGITLSKVETNSQDRHNGVNLKSKLPSEGTSSSYEKRVTNAADSSVLNNGSSRVHHFVEFIAVYEFQAQLEGELSLKEGDKLMVYSDIIGTQEGWLKGKSKAGEGWFPESYVEPLVAMVTQQHHQQTSEVETESSQNGLSAAAQDNQEYNGLSTAAQNNHEYNGLSTAAQDNQEYNGLSTAAQDNHEYNGLSTAAQDNQEYNDGLELYSNFSEFSNTTEPPVATQSNHSSQLASSLQKAELCQAMYDYVSDEPGDLVFHAGDIITVELSDGEWWTGSIDGRSGVFPANYVQLLESNQMQVGMLPAVSPAPPPPPPNVASRRPTVLHISSLASVDNTIQTDRDVSVKPSEQNASQSSSTSKHSRRRPADNRRPEVATVVLSFDGTGTEQLSLRPGQLIHVRQKSSSGWWEGELQARGQKKRVGWFPADYVKLLGQSNDAADNSQLRPSSNAQIEVQEEASVSPSSVPSNTPLTYVDQVVAKYTYQAQHEDELSFPKGVVINVLSKEDPEWWQGELDGQVGVFPFNYVTSLTDPGEEHYGTVIQSSIASRTAMSIPVLSEIEQTRQKHIQELITTEETFTKDLSTVIEVFYKPFKAEEVLTEEELNTLFINWRELRVCNMKLMKALRVRLKTSGGQPIQVIGDILCENLPHMTPYIRFCSGQLNSAALLQKKTETDNKFKEVHKKCCQSQRSVAMPLSSFLLKPMQRITRYPLMIEKILQHTPQGHPDHNNIQDALCRATELCNQVNEGVREKENSDQLEWLQNHVHCEGLTEKLTFNSVTNCLGPRKYLHSGTLYKVKSGKELVGILFNDFLLLTQPQRPLGTVSSIFRLDLKANAHFKMYRSPIFLNEVMVKKQSTDDDPDGVVLHLKHTDRLYLLRAPSSTDRDTWLRKIEAASKEYFETEAKKREKAHQTTLARYGSVGRLMVVVVEGCNLKACNPNGKSDPYCEISMGAQEHKTKVIQNSLNPKWNASMQFTIKDLQEDVLCITVYDRDLFSPNDFLGRTEIRVNEILRDTKSTKGPVTKRLLLHEVETGEVVVKLNIQLFDNH